MPTKRRRREIAWRGPEFSEDRREHLLLGFSLLGKGYGRDRGDLEAAEADWRAHRGELLAFWTQDPAAWKRDNREGFYTPAPGGPGTRPWGWWVFDAPRGEPRRRLDGTPTPPEAAAFFGMWDIGDEAHGPLFAEEFESEAAYLARHHLLLPSERLALGVGA